MLSGRLPRDLEPNAWARLLEERRAAGAALLDLSETNPTRVGLGGAGPQELAALAQAAGARYEPDPRGSRAAREAVAGYYAARGQAVDPERIVLTASTSESYTHLFRLLADPGGTFLVPAPSYPLFEPLAALEGVALRPYQLAYDGAWHLDTHSLEQAFGPDVRGVIAVQPNHPTGSCLDAGERALLATLCERHGAAVVADEVFGDFARGQTALPSFVGEARVPTFVLSGLSKVCGMPQMKLGWIVADGPPAARDAALRGLEWIADLFLSVSTPVQVALPRAARGARPVPAARARAGDAQPRGAGPPRRGAARAGRARRAGRLGRRGAGSPHPHRRRVGAGAAGARRGRAPRALLRLRRRGLPGAQPHPRARRLPRRLARIAEFAGEG